MHPIPDESIRPHFEEAISILPPLLRCLPGRPKKLRRREVVKEAGHEKGSTQQKHLHSISRKKKSGAPTPQPPSSPAVVDSTNNIGTISYGNAVVFNAMSYGAVGDGIADDTEAIKKAWDAACQSQTPAMLFLAQKYSFIIQTTTFSGPCKNDQLIFQEGSDCDSPAAIRFLGSSNVRMQGLRVENSPKFQIVLDKCQDIHVEFLSFKSPADNPNTDGIHVENSKNIEIYHSTISIGDDCISIGAGSFNVDIKNITCGPGHGISIGSLGKDESRACVSDISVSDSVIKNSDNGVPIKTWQGGSGSVSKVTFSNIQMETVQNPIIIDQYYYLQKKCPNQTSALMISDIKYTNIYGTYDKDSPPMYLACSDSIPCTNITLSELELRPAQGKSPSDPFCWKAYGNVRTISTSSSTMNQIRCLLKGFPKSNIRLQKAEKLC
nr:polygalacturonase At1g48100-like [Ziziphus jujuba var. spinosa]